MRNCIVQYHLSDHLNSQHRMILWATRPSNLPGDDIKDKDMVMQMDDDLGASHAGIFSEVLQIDHSVLRGGLSKASWKPWPCCDGAGRALALRKMCAIMGMLKGSQDYFHFTDSPCPLLSYYPQYYSWVILYMIWTINLRLNCLGPNLDVWVVVEINIDWHMCLVTVHSKAQSISKFLMFMCITDLKKLSFEGEQSCKT